MINRLKMEEIDVRTETYSCNIIKSGRATSAWLKTAAWDGSARSWAWVGLLSEPTKVPHGTHLIAFYFFAIYKRSICPFVNERLPDFLTWVEITSKIDQYDPRTVMTPTILPTIQCFLERKSVWSTLIPQNFSFHLLRFMRWNEWKNRKNKSTCYWLERLQNHFKLLMKS